MAIMRKEQKDIAGLGPIGILGEALKLLWAHSKVFNLIQLTLMLPLVILIVALELWVYIHIPLQNLNSQLPGGPMRVPHPASHFRNPLHGSDPPPLFPYVVLLVGAVITILFQAALSLSEATTLYCVGLHYTGQPISFLGVLRASGPSWWMRLIPTNSYLCLLLYSLLFLFYLYIPTLRIVFWTYEILLLTMAVCFIVIFTIASAVCVMEEDYGWAAVSRSLRLLKGKVIVAVLFELLWGVRLGVHLYFEDQLTLQIFKGSWYGFSWWRVMLVVCGVVVFLAWTTFTWQLRTLCSGVQYVSFKAYHEESLVDSFHERRTMERGYDFIGDGSNEALLEGQPADSTV